MHLHIAASYRDQHASVEKLQRTTHDTLVDTEHKLQKTKKEMENLQHKHKEDQESWETHVNFIRTFECVICSNYYMLAYNDSKK